MVDSPRIDDLRRRVQKDPASIAFAQLAEECRRAGEYQESIDVCRAGLALHPGYLSARVTLGRALIEVDQLDEAQAELEVVLASASENLAAIRGLAEIFHRRGALVEALKQYRAALALARNDPDLERTVTELSRAIEPKPPAPVFDGLSFEQLANEFLANSPPPAPVAPSFVSPVSAEDVASAETPSAEALPAAEEEASVDAAAGGLSSEGVVDVPPPPDAMAAWSQSSPAEELAPEVAAAEASPVDVWPSVSDEESDTVSDPVWNAVPDQVSDTGSDTPSDTVSDPAVAADAPSGHNGTALHLASDGVDTLIPSLHDSREDSASPVDSIGQETDVPAVVLSESPLAAAEDAALTDEGAATPVEGATRTNAHATLAALDQWLDAIHVARADRRA